MGTRSKAYLIEFNKLVTGLNEFDFTLDDQFLAGFDYSPVEHCAVEVDLKLTKSEHMYDLKFDFKGTCRLVCDTCAEDIDLPIKQKFGLLIKLSEANNFDDSEIIYIARTEIEFDLKQYLYESLLLALPAKKNCEGLSEPKPCNQEVLKRLAYVEMDEDEDEDNGEDGDDDDENDPRWNKLKDLLN
ncbi:MAG: hypothetical protein CFE21_10430 [Bacteroidetes bacterium B1(2017)]|nr:MAG: hypothetical protein CFE21_10430 [Bacteroidetes bacterium B1(2017)]